MQNYWEKENKITRNLTIIRVFCRELWGWVSRLANTFHRSMLGFFPLASSGFQNKGVFLQAHCCSVVWLVCPTIHFTALPNWCSSDIQVTCFPVCLLFEWYPLLVCMCHILCSHQNCKPRLTGALCFFLLLWLFLTLTLFTKMCYSQGETRAWLLLCSLKGVVSERCTVLSAAGVGSDSITGLTLALYRIDRKGGITFTQ